MKAHNNSDNLDLKLASVNQEAMRKVVQQLPEDSLSLAWRSSLNERLMAEAAAKRPRFRFSLIAMPAAGLAVAASLAVVVFFHAPSSSERASAMAMSGNNSSLAQGLFDTYRQESVSHEIIGSGPDPSSEVARPSMADIAADSAASEVDPDSL